MSDIPTPSRVTLVASRILEIFDVSEAEARELATGIVLHAEGWGGVDLPVIEWDREVTNRFGVRLKWRSDVARERFLKDKQATAAAYESYIRARKKSLTRRQSQRRDRSRRVLRIELPT